MLWNEHVSQYFWGSQRCIKCNRVLFPATTAAAVTATTTTTYLHHLYQRFANVSSNLCHNKIAQQVVGKIVKCNSAYTPNNLNTRHLEHSLSRPESPFTSILLTLIFCWLFWTPTFSKDFFFLSKIRDSRPSTVVSSTCGMSITQTLAN